MWSFLGTLGCLWLVVLVLGAIGSLFVVVVQFFLYVFAFLVVVEFGLFCVCLCAAIGAGVLVFFGARKAVRFLRDKYRQRKSFSADD